jgi:hypothetical protein
LSSEDFVVINDQPGRGIRVGRCDGDKRFISFAGARESGGAIVFVFDHGGHFVQTLVGRSDHGAAESNSGMSELLAALEPYTFEDSIEIRPFTCRIAGTTCGLFREKGDQDFHLKLPRSALPLRRQRDG